MARYSTTRPEMDKGQISSKGGSSKPQSVLKVFVGGLPQNTTETQIIEYFSQFGNIEKSELFIPRGFGYVSFVATGGVDRCLAQKYHQINNKYVDVKKSFPAVKGNAASGGASNVGTGGKGTTNSSDTGKGANRGSTGTQKGSKDAVTKGGKGSADSKGGLAPKKASKGEPSSGGNASTSVATVTPGGVSGNDSRLNELLAMGFGNKQSKRVLAECGWDLNTAIDKLLDEGIQKDPAEVEAEQAAEKERLRREQMEREEEERRIQEAKKKKLDEEKARQEAEKKAAAEKAHKAAEEKRLAAEKVVAAEKKAAAAALQAKQQAAQKTQQQQQQQQKPESKTTTAGYTDGVGSSAETNLEFENNRHGGKGAQNNTEFADNRKGANANNVDHQSNSTANSTADAFHHDQMNGGQQNSSNAAQSNRQLDQQNPNDQRRGYDSQNTQNGYNSQTQMDGQQPQNSSQQGLNSWGNLGQNQQQQYGMNQQQGGEPGSYTGQYGQQGKQLYGQQPNQPGQQQQQQQYGNPQNQQYGQQGQNQQYGQQQGPQGQNQQYGPQQGQQQYGQQQQGQQQQSHQPQQQPPAAPAPQNSAVLSRVDGPIVVLPHTPYAPQETGGPNQQFLNVQTDKHLEVQLYNVSNSGWSYGREVQEVANPQAGNMQPQPKAFDPAPNAQPGWFPTNCFHWDIVKANYDFLQQPEESRSYLKFRAGQRILVEERYPYLWWQGVVIDEQQGSLSKKGFFPANYVAAVEAGPPSTGQPGSAGDGGSQQGAASNAQQYN